MTLTQRDRSGHRGGIRHRSDPIPSDSRMANRSSGKYRDTGDGHDHHHQHHRRTLLTTSADHEDAPLADPRTDAGSTLPIPDTTGHCVCTVTNPPSSETVAVAPFPATARAAADTIFRA